MSFSRVRVMMLARTSHESSSERIKRDDRGTFRMKGSSGMLSDGDSTDTAVRTCQSLERQLWCLAVLGAESPGYAR